MRGAFVLGHDLLEDWQELCERDRRREGVKSSRLRRILPAPDSCELRNCRAEFCQELKIGGANAESALDRFCPPRTMAEREQAHVPKGATIAVNGPDIGPYSGHGGPVNSVAYAPDGATLASGGGDGTVRIWDASHRAAAAPAHRPHRRGVVGGLRPRRRHPGQRRRRRHGADLGRPHRPAAARAHRPHRLGAVGGLRPRRRHPGQRRRRRHGADLGRPHRPAAAPAHRPHRRGAGRWPTPPTAPPWPAAATTARCGSGTPAPASSSTSSPATPAG